MQMVHLAVAVPKASHLAVKGFQCSILHESYRAIHLLPVHCRKKTGHVACVIPIVNHMTTASHSANFLETFMNWSEGAIESILKIKLLFTVRQRYV